MLVLFEFGVELVPMAVPIGDLILEGDDASFAEPEPVPLVIALVLASAELQDATLDVPFALLAMGPLLLVLAPPFALVVASPLLLLNE